MGHFPWTLLSALRCPYCEARLQVVSQLDASSEGIVHVVLGCDCYAYPVVRGIPVLRQMSSVESTRNRAVECLRKGDAEGALSSLLASGSAPGVSVPGGIFGEADGKPPLYRRLRTLVQPGRDSAAFARIQAMDGLKEVLEASRPRDYANYLYYRFANPSFLGAIPPLLVLGDACQRSDTPRFLDLLSGIGHVGATVSALYPGVEVIMADFDFVNLYIARRFLAPNAFALCLDAELPLPFSDRTIDVVSCLDGLHYVRSKAALLREVDRIVDASGAWLFAHLHNAAGTNMHPGVPLDSRAYSEHFTFGQQRMLTETEVHRQFQEDGSLDLALQGAMAELDSSDALTLIGARNGNLWKLHSQLDAALAQRPDLLGFNPLYRVESVADGLVAHAAWPSRSMQEECGQSEPVLRETVQIDTTTMNAIATARRGGSVSEEVRVLLRSFVLVCLPECYRLADFLFNV